MARSEYVTGIYETEPRAAGASLLRKILTKLSGVKEQG
jgi:hypothetical protein